MTARALASAAIFWRYAGMNSKRMELEKELVRSKLVFTRFWVNRMLESTNKEWSSEQKRFIDAVFAGRSKRANE